MNRRAAPESSALDSDEETRRRFLDAKAPADLKRSQDLTPPPAATNPTPFGQIVNLSFNRSQTSLHRWSRAMLAQESPRSRRN